MTKRTGKPVGRPKGSDGYLPEMDAAVVEMGREGKTKIEMCAALDISYTTFLKYQADHPSFMEAVSKAQMHSQAWWEAKGRSGIDKGVNSWSAQTYQFMMKNRFKDAETGYTDKSTVEHTGDAFKDFLAAARKAGGKGPANPHEGDDDKDA